MKKYVLSVLLSLSLIGLASSETINVDVADFAFTPADVVCSVGDTIVWTLSNGTHTTTSTSVPPGAATWDYTFTGAGDTYTYVIEAAGDYTYECTIHPIMQGTIRAGYSLPMVENFDYPEGDSLRNYGGWKNHSGSGTIIQMTSGSLAYPGYSASGIGNSVTVAGGSGSREDVNKLFHEQSQGAVYAGFLVNVASASTTGDYFFHFAPYFPTSLFRARVFVRDDGAGNLQFGLSFASTSTVEYTTATYSYGVTYLLVDKYEYVNDASGSDDIAKLYINPVLTDPEPSTPDLQSTDTNTDQMIGAIALRQGGNAYEVQIDGIKVSTLWSDVVPVELTSFTATAGNNSVTLNWKTATETNNSGFEVQRKTSNSDWTNLSFVNGNGTSTQSHNYSYVDNNLQSGKYYYRLKQVDLNGSYEYSQVAEAEVNAPAKFELAQNYPNPFNPATKINFSVPSNGNVKLTVYNVLGQEIAVLINGFMQAGSHSADFSGSDLNSGLYFYKLESNGNSLVKKMMLLK